MTPIPRHSRALLTAALLAAALLASPLVAAHARLQSSVPPAGAALAAAPREIALTFNEKIEPAFSSVTLEDGAGRAVAAGKVNIDKANPAVLHLDVPALAAGAYTVKWAVAGRDGHRRSGQFTFAVK